MPLRLGIRSKLFLVSLGLILLSLAVVYSYARPILDRSITARIRADLQIRLELIALQVGSAPIPESDRAGYYQLLGSLSQRAHGRVTLVKEDGTVIADSDVPPELLYKVENHRSRPEIVDALQLGIGTSTRDSATLRRSMMYVALPLQRPGSVRWVARLAMPLLEVDRAVAGLHVALSIGALLGLLCAVFMSSVAAHLAARNVRLLTRAARKMVQGDLGAPAQPAGEDEIALLGRDLTQLAQSLSVALRNLLEERDLLNSVLLGMREGVLLLDSQLRIALLNPALCEMLDVVASSSLTGHPIAELVHDEKLLNQLQTYLTAAAATQRLEIQTPFAKSRRLLVQQTQLLGPRAGWLLVFIDVTELRRLEQLRRDFVANASHELRTPVAAVRSALETLRLSASQEPQSAERFLDIIERNAERLHRLVDDLLDLSRIESQQFRVELAPQDVPEILVHALTLFESRAHHKGIALEIAAEEDLPPVYADRRAVDQVLSNLIDNAIKYCPSGSRVQIHARAVEVKKSAAEEAAGPQSAAPTPAIEIAVTDNGPGIAAEHLPRLFERFYRVDAGRSREVGGTGLGLAIVRSLVDAMGGSVVAVSQVGSGSSFRFVLPAPAAPAPPAPVVRSGS